MKFFGKLWLSAIALFLLHCDKPRTLFSVSTDFPLELYLDGKHWESVAGDTVLRVLHPISGGKHLLKIQTEEGSYCVDFWVFADSYPVLDTKLHTYEFNDDKGSHRLNYLNFPCDSSPKM